RAQHRTLTLEREMREEQLGLVGSDEGECRVADQRTGGRGDDRRDRVAERLGPGRRSEQVAAEIRDLSIDQGADQLLLAGEVPVHRGSGTTGLAGDVVEGRLGQPDAADTRQGGVEEPDRLRRCLAMHHLRQSRIERLIVNMSTLYLHRNGTLWAVSLHT